MPTAGSEGGGGRGKGGGRAQNKGGGRAAGWGTVGARAGTSRGLPRRGRGGGGRGRMQDMPRSSVLETVLMGSQPPPLSQGSVASNTNL